LGVYKVYGTTKEKFVVNAIQAKMQHYHLHTTRHAIRATIVAISYEAKHEIINNDMV